LENLRYPRELISQFISKLKIEFSSVSMEQKYDIISKFLKPNVYQKKQNGEVFTPLTLVNEMLDKLPSEVWNNKNYKWLDPAVGIGNFPIIVFERLMKGLSKEIPDEQVRRKHILENMLYAVDICPVNISIYKLIMGYPKDYQSKNIVTGSFLDDKTFQGFTFDVIVGNPPYNAPGNTNTGNVIWTKFLGKSILNIKTSGYLVFVHPPGWRRPASNKSKNKGLFQLMTKQNTLMYLEMHDSKDGMQTFLAGTKYDWYVLRKGNECMAPMTTVKDEEGIEQEVDLTKWDWLPNGKLNIVLKLMASGDEARASILYDRSAYGADKAHISTKCDINSPHPIVHSTPKSGVRYMYSSKNDRRQFGVSKVIFGDSGINEVVVDIGGKFGMTQHAMAIQVDSEHEAQEVCRALKSREFGEVLKSLQWSNYQIDWLLFTYFKRDWYKHVKTQSST